MEEQESKKTLKQALLELYWGACIVTADHPGNIPRCVDLVFQAEFSEDVPAIRAASVDQGKYLTVGQLQHGLSMLSGLGASAQSLLRRASALLVDPPMSMNIPLREGEDLPAALHTLLQGTVWAVMMGAGADPDLRRTPWERAWDDRQSYGVQDKQLWFLCKKFFFSRQVAEKDGYASSSLANFSRCYAGRLFIRSSTDHHDAWYCRVHVPAVELVVSHESTFCLTTPHGLFGLGKNRWKKLGLDVEGEITTPTRLAFPCCPDVERYEQQLPPWRKDRLVTEIAMTRYYTLIRTPVGIIYSGKDCKRFIGSTDSKIQKYRFNPVILPDDFAPSHIAAYDWLVLLTAHRTQLIAGDNRQGQLGLGHFNRTNGFTATAFPVDAVFPLHTANIFLSSGRLLFAGKVPSIIAHSGLLPGLAEGDVCAVPRPLRFEGAVKGFVCDSFRLFYVQEGRTVCVDDGFFTTYELPFEATHISQSGCVMRPDGSWVASSVTADETEFTPASEGEAEQYGPAMRIVPVDIA
ncbi:hypothetical protein J8273_2312 [Carpediemonas membranifera]|uniref:Uncharacterized protein n=1 Tax=Carpediemonas membranifera TaxID=201153 RepID=A0A8J6E3I1_9EUKA|nr:hypothetical protein J8273_2312 [Carpediemonas membranifera]|eukprot:KAG9395963.1 hypothetical protein J8273_2312 [Carpediemonas membranifera]